MRAIGGFVILVVLFFGACLLPVAGLAITGYTEPTVLNGIEFVRIMQGDDPVYKDPAYDDSAWTVTSLPLEWEGIYPAYNGICWYRLSLVLPAALPADSIGIRLGIICDADETFFNGIRIGGYGVVGENPVSAYDKIRIYELPAGLIRPGGVNVLALRIRGMFSYMNGPYTGTVKIDKFDRLLNEYYSGELRDLVFVVIYVVVGIYFLLFFIRRSKDKENLFFALFCLLISTYFFLRTQLKYMLGFSFFWSKMMEYLVLTWLVYLLMEFLLCYFKKKHWWFHYTVLGSCIVFSLLVLFTSSYRFWDNLNQYVVIPTWLVGVVVGFYVIVSKLKSELDARLMFVTLVILFAAMVNDILVNALAYKFIRLANYGFLFFIGSIAIILSNRFVRLHIEVADLNVNLEQKVLTRTEELNLSVRQLAAAKEETDNILRNVQEGIFLLDHEMRIGIHYSAIMERIFARKDLGGTNLLDLLKECTEPELANQAADFLQILFTRSLSEKRMKLLNPLEDVRAVFEREGERAEKFLSFAFARIGAEGENAFVLVTVQDITDRKFLAQKIRTAEKQAEKEAALFMGIIHLNPALLKNFLKEVQLEIQYMEDCLKKAQFTPDIRKLLTSIYASVHAVKGDAAMLEIKPLAEITHAFEDTLNALFHKEDLKAVELIDLPYGLAEMKAILMRIERIIDKITQFRSSFGKGELSDEEYMTESIKNMASRVAEREQKKVHVDLRTFRLPAHSGLNILALKKVLLQLVKNAVVHGIETPAEREQKGKPAAGRIIVKSEFKEKSLVLKITDDGGNLDTGRIRQAVLAAGKHSEADLAALPPEKIALLIFETGVSTQNILTIDAGRGIGLDLVKESVKQLGGKISLAYETGKYTQFRLSLPLSGEQAKESE